jgi:VWFA-related protein
VLSDKLLEDRTILYVIVIQDLNDRTSLRARREGVSNLKWIAEQTGGQTFAADSARQVTAAFERITAAIGAQYRLEFFPNNPPRPDKFREIRVRTTRKGIVLSAPAGYFAPVP